jgi:hypothetical protein
MILRIFIYYLDSLSKVFLPLHKTSITLYKMHNYITSTHWNNTKLKALIKLEKCSVFIKCCDSCHLSTPLATSILLGTIIVE